MTQVSKTVDNALSLLHLLGETGSATAVELSRMTGLSRTVVHRSLVTMERQGFTRRHGSTYSLGFSILRLADGVEPDIRDAARPGLERLASTFDATSVLVVADGPEGVILDEFVSQSGPAQLRYSVGFRSSLTLGSHGRAILAYSEAAIVEAAIADLADQSSVEHLHSQLEQIRAAGHAFSTDEVRSGVSGLAAPVLDRRGRAMASIGVVTLSGRFPQPEEVARELKEVAAQVADRLMR